MTEHEAIDWLKAISVTQKDSIHTNSLLQRKEAIHMAIESLKRQILKKPHKYIAFDGIERNGCPHCFEERNANEILYAGQKYCSVCGQKLDWGDE